VESAFGSPLSVTDAGGTVAGGTLLGNATLESMSAIMARSDALRLMPTTQVRYAPVAWFTNRVTLGADITQSDGVQLFPKNNLGWYPDRTPYGNELTETRRQDRFYTVDYLGNIRYEFGAGKRTVSDLSFGSQYINRVSDQLSGLGQGLISNDAQLVTNANTSVVGQRS
jgi:hypothetical protein